MPEIASGFFKRFFARDNLSTKTESVEYMPMIKRLDLGAELWGDQWAVPDLCVDVIGKGSTGSAMTHVPPNVDHSRLISELSFVLGHGADLLLVSGVSRGKWVDGFVRQLSGSGFSVTDHAGEVVGVGERSRVLVENKGGSIEIRNYGFDPTGKKIYSEYEMA